LRTKKVLEKDVESRQGKEERDIMKSTEEKRQNNQKQ